MEEAQRPDPQEGGMLVVGSQHPPSSASLRLLSSEHTLWGEADWIIYGESAQGDHSVNCINEQLIYLSGTPHFTLKRR